MTLADYITAVNRPGNLGMLHPHGGGVYLVQAPANARRVPSPAAKILRRTSWHDVDALTRRLANLSALKFVRCHCGGIALPLSKTTASLFACGGCGKTLDSKSRALWP